MVDTEEILVTPVAMLEVDQMWAICIGLMVQHDRNLLKNEEVADGLAGVIVVEGQDSIKQLELEHSRVEVADSINCEMY